ncbi:MAG TPA: hypothetical protein VFS46_08490 [Nitrososphaera sp.]|nr:hypothetical protein [Nitrososphaera sp.]
MEDELGLNFRDCLLLAVRLFGFRQQLRDVGFDASEFSRILQKHLTDSGYAAQDPASLKQVSTKRISNDLDRLYRMRFLEAQRVKRKVITRSGKKCTRGYQYLYRISKQGLQYYGYLINPEQAHLKNEKDKSARLLGVSRRRIRADIVLGPGIPGDVKDILMDFEYKRGRLSNRFPLRYGPSIAQKYVVARKMLRNLGVTDGEFARELEKTSAMADVVYPHLHIYQKITEKRERKKIMLDRDGENRQFLGLLKISK